MSSPSTCIDWNSVDWRQVLAFIATMLLCAHAAQAKGILEELVKPGELAQAHAKFEGKCDSCHSSFKKADQTRLCLSCHKAIAADVVRYLGFHGRNPDVWARPKKELRRCKTCHTEHEGRRFDIAQFDHNTFNHLLTDFALEGRHRKVKCRSCHQTAGKFRDAPHACAACHGKNDPHKGQLGNDCASCHTPKDWRDIAFDHNRTRFPLTGAHARAQCAACHTGGRFKNVATECVSCHGKDDKHQGRFGPNCKTCHTAQSWKNVRFNHNSYTDYALIGHHRTVACESCHTGNLYKDRVDRQCISCHAEDDAHKGSAGTNCQSCHTPAGWKSASFDHNTKTRFPLRGAHVNIPCKTCHIQPPEKVKPPTACAGCHSKDDAHRGQQGTACGNCHSETRWRADVRFNHDLAAFPLIGRHRQINCVACHRTTAFKDAASECSACHENDDWHKGTLGPECGACHNPTGWKFWHFDHAKQADYPLTGAHDGLECAACHREKTRRKVRQSTLCISCHRKDDAHDGGFGRNCGRCHTTTSFKGRTQLNR